MSAGLIGLVYYEDDPRKAVFRKVYPTLGDPPDVLDQARWVTEGCDPARKATLRKVWHDSPIALAAFDGVP